MKKIATGFELLEFRHFDAFLSSITLVDTYESDSDIINLSREQEFGISKTKKREKTSISRDASTLRFLLDRTNNSSLLEALFLYDFD